MLCLQRVANVDDGVKAARRAHEKGVKAARRAHEGGGAAFGATTSSARHVVAWIGLAVFVQFLLGHGGRFIF